VAASKPPLKHRVEQRITASDSTESLIRFCKEIDFATENSGKSNHRNSQNYPTTSGNSGFFTDDVLESVPALMPKNASVIDTSSGTRTLLQYAFPYFND
jgi:hypothetical protein